MLVQLTPDGAAFCEQCHQVVGQKLHGVNKMSADEVAAPEQLLKEGPAVTIIRRGKMMSRRNNDAITIHSILSWIEDNLRNRPCRWKKCLSAQVTPSGTCNVCFKKETGHSLASSTSRSRKLTESAKAQAGNEPILYLADATVSNRSRP